MKIKIALKAGISALNEKAKAKPNGGYRLPDGTRVLYKEAATALKKIRDLAYDRTDTACIRTITPCALCKHYCKNIQSLPKDVRTSKMCWLLGIEVSDDFFCKHGIDNEIGDN